jgi:hypothetical protein
MPYDYLTINPEQLNFGLVSASYFDTDLQKLYEQTLVPEKGFFGDGDDDIVELSLYDTNQNILGFNRIIPKVTYSVVQGSFRDINNNLQSYSYANPSTNIVRYSNEILLHSQFDLNYNQVSPGLYYVLYNPIRNIAGNQTNNLVIKEVSPSRTELRLSFAFDTVKNEQSRLDSVKIRAFADKKYIFLQIEDNFVTIVDNNPIEQDFAANENQYNLYEISQLLGFKNKADLQEYISSTYYGFNKIIKTNITTEVLETKTFVGIAEQIKNFSYRYNDVEFIKEEILESLRIIVLKVSQDRILERTSLNPISLNIVLDFFQKVIYNDWLLPKVSELLDNYYNNFYDYYKNSLNFNNGRLIKILNHTSYFNEIDNSVNIQIKLDEPLPTEFDVKTLCWISNISIAPIYFKVNLFTQQLSRKVYLNGVNFNVEVPTVSPTNQKFEDNNIDTLDYAKVKLKQRINDLFINFDDFNDFINYSSAELRSKIAKNKILYYANLENEKNLLITTAKNSVYSISASYSRDVKLKTQEQISLLNTFDDYESYLFFNTSSINEKIENGISFDKNNYNSLTYQLPEYIRTDTESADYLKFTAMIGHFFDNILVFIKKFPKNYPIVNDDRNNYPKNYIEELLNSLNWNANIAKFEQSDLNQLYFTNTETTGSLSSSYFDYAKSILNRLTNNISAIYKSKGTGTSFDLIRTIFGIPKELIQIKEYGSPDILSNKTSFYEYDTLLYFTKFDRDNYLKFNHTGSDSYFVKSEFQSVNLINNNLTQSIEYTSVFQGVSSVELSFRLNSINYEYGEKIPLIKKDRIFNDWSIYIKKDKQKESGTVIFEINPVENEKTSSIRSLELPFFNNNFYTLLLKREVLPGFTFDAVSFSSSLQKNQYPSIVLENEPTFNNFVVEDDGDFVAIPPILNKLTQSFFIESSRKYVPHLYTLEINQYDGEQLIFNSKSTKIITYETNRFFSSGSYYIGNYPLSNNNFVGNIDKLKVFKDAISDADFNEHSYNLNSISIENKSDLYSNLFYLWSFDTPINLYNSSSISSSILNQNLKYQLNKFEAFNFKQTDKYFSSPICATLKVDEFPYQFDVLKIKQVINTNNFGPNFAGNNKINKISETVSSNLVPYDYSTFSTDIIGDDSSLVQFSISPYDYLNEKIKDFVGKEGITNIIGDPKYLTSQNYPELVLLQKDFKKFNQKYIYPQEFFTTYKFYIDFSIFEFVKNLKPARVNLLTGLVLQPSLLERKKFGYKDVNFSNTSILSINFDNKTNLDLSIKNTNFTSSNTTVSTLDNQYKTDHNTYNFHQFQIKDTVDDRDFIYCKYGKLVKMSDNGFLVRDVNLVNDKESYQLVNNRIPINQNINGTTGTAGTAGSSGTSGTSGKLNVNRDKSNGYVCTFSSSFDRVEIIGSGSGYSLKINPYDSSGTSGTSGKNVYAYNLQITGSKELLNPYYGVRNSGYSRKHLSKTRLAGSRYRFIALSGSKYTIQNGIKILNPVSDYKITYYDYIKGKNDSNTTVNRQGIPNGSEPIISVPGFLSLDVDSNNFPIYGKVLTPEGSAAGTFESLPLTASQCTSASLNTYIKNL